MALELTTFLVYLSLLSIRPVSFTNAQDLARPGCTSTCDNITIPYPFGIGRKCYRDKGFEVFCTSPSEYNASRRFPDENNSSRRSPDGYNTSRQSSDEYARSILILGVTRTQVRELSLDQVRIRGPTISRCYDSKSGEERRTANMLLDLNRTPFTFSHTRNKFAAAGCDIFSYISVPNNSKLITGCVSLCDSNAINRDVMNASCSGFGCCQTNIPKGLKAFDLSVYSINTKTRSWASDSNACSFAALNDWASFPMLLNGSVEYAVNFTGNYSTATLDWVIDSASCQDIARNKSNSACIAANSECINSSNGPGYRCTCSRGYLGNPYLLHGCQAINECDGPNPCVRGAKCINTEGGYYCKCPIGYSGDGRKQSAGCFPSSHPTVSRISMLEAVLIGTGVALGLLFLVAFSYWLHKKISEQKERKLKAKFFKKNGGLLLEQQLSADKGNVEKTKVFVSEELEKATDNFNESRVLGRGGSGTVYKGMLNDGKIVAIKKSKIMDESQTGQFINELVILSQLNHKHVVKLLGCCLDTEVPLLVYEYISNGTLSHHLYDDILKLSISWEHRLRISTEIAGALSYMHSSASTPIFHRDIKSSNILLNEAYKAVVSDFGISRSVPCEKTHLTTLVQGTFGYLDPEYFRSGQFTEKSDVYSFGVVLVELLTGEKPISDSRLEDAQNLAMHFISSVKQGRLFDILDTQVLTEAGKEEIVVIAKLARRCLKLVGKKRPTMKEVVVELEGLRKPQDHPLTGQDYQLAENLVDQGGILTLTGPQSR